MFKKILNSVLNILKSRTVWTIIVLFIINGISGIREYIPVNILTVVDSLLGLAAIYFRINPKQKF